MFTLTLTVAAAQERTVDAIRAGAPAVKRWGGRILLIVGIWLANLALFANFWADVPRLEDEDRRRRRNSRR